MYFVGPREKTASILSAKCVQQKPTNPRVRSSASNKIDALLLDVDRVVGRGTLDRSQI